MFSFLSLSLTITVQANPEKTVPISVRAVIFRFLLYLLLAQEGGADSNFCRDKSDGLHANPSDCSRYYTCHVGITYEHSCGATLVFNTAPAVMSCDFPRNVDCLSGGVRGTNPGFCHDKTDGLHAHPTDCSKYYNCHSSNGVATSCPAGTLYNRDRKYCDWEDRVTCPSGGGRTKTSFCSGKSDGMYPDPTDCTKYYQCYHSGTTAKHSCFSGLYFDPNLKVCNWPDQVQCTTSPTAAPTAAPTVKPTAAPTATPTAAPTATPTAAPTATPTAAPTATPTVAPTAKPTAGPTATPTKAPTVAPTAAPTQGPPTGNQCQRRVCYHTNWSQYRPGVGKFTTFDLDPFLCTHIMYSFANLVDNELVAFEWNDESDDWTVGNYERVSIMARERERCFNWLLW